MKKTLLLSLLLSNLFGAFAQTNKEPKIIVGIVVDQMCYDYLYRFAHLYTSGGFNKLLTKGTNCRNTQYNYVPTYTAPGHASIYTGTTPSNHGIVSNDWYNRDLQKSVTSVSDERYQTVGSVSGGQAAPMNLLTYTITDQLKLASPKSKVISQNHLICNRTNNCRQKDALQVKLTRGL